MSACRVYSTPPLRGPWTPVILCTPPPIMHFRWTPPLGGCWHPPTRSPLGWLFNTPQREFILSVFHCQKIDYRPNHQILFLILTVQQLLNTSFWMLFGGKWAVCWTTMVSAQCSCFFCFLSARRYIDYCVRSKRHQNSCPVGYTRSFFL